MDTDAEPELDPYAGPGSERQQNVVLNPDQDH